MPRDPNEPVRLTKIYTRGGDKGETSLGDGSRASKLDPRIRAYGIVDAKYGGASDGRFAYIAHGIIDSLIAWTSECASRWTSLMILSLS